MSIQTATCYWLICDICGGGMENGDGVTIHYSDCDDALTELVDEDWTVWGNRHWCWRVGCVPLCICGHGFAEHDDDGGPCLDARCASLCEDFRPQPPKRSDDE